MKDELLRHKLAYFILTLGVMIFVIIFLGAWPDRWIQRVVVVSFALFYFLWGALTHFKTKTITRSVIAEYGMVAILAVVLLLLITM